MAKENRIKLKYRHGKLPEEFRGLICKADDCDMKVLLAIAMLAKKTTGEASVNDVCKSLEMNLSDVKASLKFWRGAGVIEDVEEKENSKDNDAESSVGSSAAHREGALEHSNVAEEYSTGELADIINNRVVTPVLIDEAQRIFGKIFRTYDIGILVGIVERLGFEEEAVLMMLTYLANKGKKTMRYAELMAMSFHDEGITDTASVSERISRMEHSKETIALIKKMYGIGDRELTTSENRYFSKWTEKFDYNIEVIRLAYDITVDNTHEPAPRYSNTILEKWYAEGLRTADEVRKYLDRQAAEKSGSTVTKSYDTDDFFEAALKRSYEELK